MRIISFNFNKINVERKDIKIDKPKISQNIDILDISKEDNPISQSETIRLKFNFNILYSEDYAKLDFVGTIILLPEKKELIDFMDAWKSKKIPEEARIPIFNFIMHKCNVKALALEDEFGLPIHIPLPKLTFNKK